MWGKANLDEMLTPRQAAAILPNRRAGRPASYTVIYRWYHGLHGVKLRFVQVDGTRCTTRRWLSEFFDALAKVATPAVK